MPDPPLGTVLHFTHIENVPGILADGALLCDSLCQGGRLRVEAGDHGVKDRRRNRLVECAPGGVVADYVPFYYGPRSPMMFLIERGRVPTFVGHHHDLVYLVSHVSILTQAQQPFVITDRNAAKAIARFSNDPAVLGDLSQPNPDNRFVDWEIMNLTQWGYSDAYPDRADRRMAEFLVHEGVGLDLFTSFAVHNHDVRARLEQMFVAADVEVPCDIKPEWYY